MALPNPHKWSTLLPLLIVVAFACPSAWALPAPPTAGPMFRPVELWGLWLHTDDGSSGAMARVLLTGGRRHGENPFTGGRIMGPPVPAKRLNWPALESASALQSPEALTFDLTANWTSWIPVDRETPEVVEQPGQEGKSTFAGATERLAQVGRTADRIESSTAAATPTTSLAGAAPPARQETPASSGFETFSVPRPQGSISRAAAPRPRRETNPNNVAIPLGPPPGGQRGLTLSSTISLTPWDRTLFFGLTGQFSGRELESFLEVDPRTGIPIINAGYVSLQQQDAAIRVGQGSNDLFGASTGLGYTVKRKHGLSYGAGIYSLTSGLDSRLAPALNAQLALGSAGSLGLLGAADGSWRLSAKEEHSRLSLFSSLGSLSRTGGVDYGAGFNFRLLQGVSFAEQVTGRGGRNAFSGNETSMEMRRGPALFNLSLWNSSDVLSRAAEQSITALLPHGRDLLILRYQSVASAALGQLTLRDTDFSAGIWRTYRSGFATWMQADRFGGGALGWQGGVSAPVLTRGQIELQVGKRPGQGIGIQRARVGLRIRSNDLIGLSYGPGISRRSEGRTGWGVDFTREFHFEAASNGSLVGHVDSIGGPLPSGVAVEIDGRKGIKVAPDGRFVVRRIAAGPHRVALDLTHAPAAWGAAGSETQVMVRAHNKSEVSLAVQLLGEISGSVRCLAPLPAAVSASHPFSDVVITLSNGRSTVTDRDGGYRFENLPPGDYQVSLAAAAIPGGYVPVGPTKWTLRVDPGAHLTQADFTLEPVQKPVIFADLGG